MSTTGFEQFILFLLASLNFFCNQNCFEPKFIWAKILLDPKLFDNLKLLTQISFSEFSNQNPALVTTCCPDITFIPDDSEPNFSIFQSNLLFVLYFMGSATVLGLDIMVQIMRRNNRKCHGRQDTGKFIPCYLSPLITFCTSFYNRNCGVHRSK